MAYLASCMRPPTVSQAICRRERAMPLQKCGSAVLKHELKQSVDYSATGTGTLMRPSFRTATALGTSLVSLIPATTAVHAASTFDWSGFYLGGSAGLVQQNATGTATYPDNITGSGFSFSGNNLYL